jgi:AI-2 transport protein TqsA
MLTRVALCLVIAAASWYLLRELAALLRPLLLAVFLCYMIIPLHGRLTQRLPGLLSSAILAGMSVGLMLLLAGLIYSSALEFNEELPALIERGQGLFNEIRRVAVDRLPPWLLGDEADTATVRAEAADRVRAAATVVLNLAAEVVSETVLVGIYLIFLLFEANRFPHKIERGFADERATQILAVYHNINVAIASYLRVKVKASLVLALPALAIFWAFGLKFALLWCVLTFLLNFVPYLGSMVSCSLPILLAFLQLPLGWQPITLAVLLISDHMLSAYLIEPSMTGKAVGLSPVVILAALAFWGLCWGVIGMFLAVPLTVTLKIILENVGFTRPIARLLGEG